jgi:hypothetical protein
MKRNQQLYGLMAEFVEANEVLAAAQRCHEAGYRRMDAFTPFPVDGLAEAVGHPRTRVPLIVLICGIIGGAGGYFMQWYATVIDYPLNIGGRPFHSWPSYVPITFELTILCAALSAVIGMLALNRLPQPYHSVFNAPHFERASQDRFFLCIEAVDPKFDLAATKDFLLKLHAENVTEVSA